MNADVCDKRFSTVKQFIDTQKNSHMKTNLMNVMFVTKDFPYQASLLSHKRTHTGDRPFECDVCDKKIFPVKLSLLKHKRTHTGNKPYECDVCNKKFSHNKQFIGTQKNSHRRQTL